jgi:molecular chaperone GrpE
MNPTDPHIPITNGDGQNIPSNIPDSEIGSGHPPPSMADATSPDLAMLQQELAVQKNNHRQVSADFDQYIKRSQRDSEQQAAVQKEDFIRNLLPIIDNLERALLAAGGANASHPLFQGVRMTLQQIAQLLGVHGIQPVADRGQPFDPHRHEAVSVQSDPNQPDQIVLEVTERGYWRGDKVFRPAQVIVNDLSRYSGGSYGR